jgi:hypothetical protein
MRFKPHSKSIFDILSFHSIVFHIDAPSSFSRTASTSALLDVISVTLLLAATEYPGGGRDVHTEFHAIGATVAALNA